MTSLYQAGVYLQQGSLDSAKAEYAKVVAMADVPEHLQTEANERIQEIARRQAGLPAQPPADPHRRLPSLPPPGLTLYVAPQGNDSNPGTAEKPFGSLDRARDEIRARRAQATLSSGSIQVVVRGGTYVVKRPFVLTAEDSGTEAAPILFRAAPSESPRFRGGLRLHGWKGIQDAAILARLPEEARGKVRWVDLRACGVTNLLPLKLGGFASGNGFRTHPAHELFFNGKAQPLARWPNQGFVHIKEVVVKDGTKGYDRQGSKIGEFIYDVERPARWTTEADLLLYGYWFWDWADSYERVQSIDPVRRVITLARPYHTYGYSVGAPFYAVNALTEIDMPGEWYLDRSSYRLFFYPPSDPEAATVELSCFAQPMVQIEQASHLRFEGLVWELGGADAIQVRNSTDCVFVGCTIRRFAGNGFEVQGGSADGLLSCNLYSMGRGGTILAGGDRKTLTPSGHFLENCEIWDLSRIDHTYTPAVAVSGVGQRIVHNRLHDVLSSAMRIDGNDHRIEYNEIFNAVLESDDQGGADMFGNPTFRGNVYRYNYWHHIGNWRATGDQPKCGQAGIRLDDAICGTLIYGNIFERCSAGKLGFGGVQIHGGKDNMVDNNVFVDCAAALSFSPWPDKRWQETVKSTLDRREIDRDLYLRRYPELARLSQNANENHIWRNVTLRCGEFLRRPSPRLDKFENTNLTEGEFKLDPNCPLFNRPGFAPIPVKDIGLYRDDYRDRLRGD